MTVRNLTEAHIQHTIQIDDIEIDATIKDPKQQREEAKRTGSIIRIVTINEEEKTTESAFSA